MVVIGEESREQTHKSGSDPGNARLQCALSTSAVLAVEHTTAATATGVARVKGGMVSSVPLLYRIHSASGVVSGWYGWVAGPERHFTDQKSPHGNG